MSINVKSNEGVIKNGQSRDVANTVSSMTPAMLHI